MITMEQAKAFAHGNGLIIFQHHIPDEPLKFTMWVNSDDPNQTRIVVPVCEEDAFLEAVETIQTSQEEELKSRIGKKRYTVGVREVHINYIRVVAENPEEAKKMAFKHQADESSLYVEYSHVLSDDLWTVEEIKWED